MKTILRKQLALAILLSSTSVLSVSAQAVAQETDDEDQNQSAQTAPQSASTSTGNESQPVMLDAFEVKSDQDYGYRAANAGSVIGIGTPIRDTPFSVSVITSDFIEDKGASELNEIVRYVSGMSSTTKDEHEIYARGFLSVIKVDGGEENRGAFSLDSADRIEVTKGPASILQGRASAGGVVNIISKKPAFNQRTDLKLSYGSFDSKKLSVTSTGPIVPQKLAYLVNYSQTDQDGWAKYTYKDEWNYLIGLTWRPFENFEVTVSTKEVDRTTGNGQHVTTSHPAFLALDIEAVQMYDNNGLPRPSNYPRLNETIRSWLNRTSGYGPDEPAEQVVATPFMYPEGSRANIQGPQQFRHLESSRHMAEVRWHINDWLDFKGSYYSSDMFKNNADISTFRQVGGLRIRERSVMVFEQQERSFYQFDFAAQFGFWGLKHRFLLGHQYRDFSGASTNLRSGVIAHDPRIDGERYIVDEVAAENGGLDPVWPNPGVGHERATYAVDVIEAFDERLHIMLGARHTHRFQGTVREHKITPQYGAVLKIPGYEDLSVYASYSESFTPNFQRDGFGNLIDPREEVNVEGGVKLEMFDGKLTGSASVFNLEQRNVALRDFAREAETGITPLYIFSGLARSEGAEADLVYTPNRNYQVLLSWSRLWEARTVEADDAKQVGVRLDGAPAYSYSLWNKYTFVSGPFKGAYIGGGVKRTGPIHVHPSWSVTIYSEPYWYVDLLVGYRWKAGSWGQADISLRVENLLDDEYLDGTFRYSEPIRGYLSFNFTF